MAHRPPLLVLGGALGGARPARRHLGDELRTGMDQRSAQLLAQRFLQRAAELRRGRLLPSDRLVRPARRCLYRAAGLRDIFAADAADTLASVDDQRLSERMARGKNLLSSFTGLWPHRQPRLTPFRRSLFLPPANVEALAL